MYVLLMASSLPTCRGDHHSRINRKTVSWLTVFLLLGIMVQAGIIYFTYFNPIVLAQSPYTVHRHRANDTRPSWVSNSLKHADTTPINSSLSNHLRQEDSDAPSFVDNLPSTELVSSSFGAVAAPYFNPSGPTWKEGSFCESFVEKTFQTPLPVCGSKMLPEHNIKCFYNLKSTRMVYCILEDALMSAPRKLGSVSNLTLLTGGEKNCPTVTLMGLHKTIEKGDSVRRAIDSVVSHKREASSVCQEWINKTAFLHSGDRKLHIYFRVNAYFNLYKAIVREGVAPGEFVIIRHRSSSNYSFPEWERKLFPEMIHIDELSNMTICFRKLVLVPRTFACILFRCKMEANIRSPCFNCKGRGLYGNSLYSFRHRVLTSCGLQDEEHNTGNRLVFVSRRPYQRWRKRDVTRVLRNEDDLVKALRENFPNTNVTVAHMEALDICAQIGLAHGADVFMGVHGAGLVHLWWLQEDGLAVELNPIFEEGNPTFNMLSTLSGRNYMSITITGTPQYVIVDVDSVIKKLKLHTHLT